ncbi:MULTISPECIES: CDP-glycerol glycerophosphotransferase family protein [Streptomyces]|uniref:CDP-glycerol:poly(Glycerophosphate)glycerophosphotransferase n=1 Tax=Streptomyces chartreusis NRRL 3882 TaxID=1079985 RepID=A0A2N9BDJ6_STRCX|nr:MULTISPECIES: CDP-glycerol glycerophosphotransferase family protein [Streptomyces]MYS88338.1 glycosyltransferase [Streptomyces sp. SID5464]SOR81438.1 CDP-glycerol:poly(glycerophosphate)glycerophosphotransferase [Streptomyces chartreusis NRRL 3882]
MAELSVIVHGPNVQDHLTELLDSLAAHPLPDAELIVAAVGDWARETADRHAADGGPVDVVPLPEGTGDAAARAAGAARASGRWLHFVHAKDGLPAGAPRTVAERVAELPGEVDVLLLDHVRSTWHTSGMPSRDGSLLAGAGRADVALDDCAPLLRLTPLLGTRVLRTDFWRAHEQRLTTDDEPYAALAALLLADRVACLPHIAYEDRRLRPASLPPVTPQQRYGLVERYESLLDLTRERRAAHAVLYDVMVRDCLRTFARGDMPEEVAREFFRRASLAALRRRPDGYRRPAGLEGVRRSLLEEGAYGRYRAFQAVNRTRRTAKSAVRARKRQAGAKLRDHQYRRALGRPVNPHLAVFSAYWNRGVACNPAAIAAKLAELAPQIHPVWVVTGENAALLPPGTDHVVPGSRRYWEVLATAKYLVNNVNFPNAVVKRPDAIHLQTHHGTPLKRMGIDQMAYPAAAQGLDFQALLERIDKWDYSVSANSHTTRMWERAYPSHYVSLDHGYPRNDVYYTAGSEDIRAVRDRLGIAPGRRAVLYAPTHRDYEAGWTPRLDLAALADRLGEDTVLLVRGHYFYGGAASPLTNLRRTGRIIDVSSYDPVEELCLAADALVTDYSSIMFDYANLDRPIVIHADDWETYRTTRGVYFDLMAEAPGPVARTQEQLTEILTTEAWRDEGAAKARAVFRRRFCEYDDGRAAERVVRRVFLGQDERSLPPVLPIEERTPAPTPQEATA